MRLPSLLVLVACSASAQQLHLAAPDLNVVDLPHSRATFFTEYLSGRMAQYGARVTTTKDMLQLLGMERQKQLLGCESDTCAAELANALGTDGLVLGDVGRIGDSYQLNLKVLSSACKVVATYQARASSEEALLDELDKGAQSMLETTAPAVSRQLTPMSVGSSGGSKAPLIVIGVGGAAAVGGVVLLALAGAKRGEIPTAPDAPPKPLSQVEAAASAGQTFQTAGLVMVGVGAAAVAGGLLWKLFGARSPVATVAVSVTPGSTLLTVGGTFE